MLIAVDKLVETIPDLAQLLTDRLQLPQHDVLARTRRLGVRLTRRLCRIHDERTAALTCDYQAFPTKQVERQADRVSRDAVLVHQVGLTGQSSAGSELPVEDCLSELGGHLPVQSRPSGV